MDLWPALGPAITNACPRLRVHLMLCSLVLATGILHPRILRPGRSPQPFLHTQKQGLVLSDIKDGCGAFCDALMPLPLLNDLDTASHISDLPAIGRLTNLQALKLRVTGPWGGQSSIYSSIDLRPLSGLFQLTDPTLKSNYEGTGLGDVLLACPLQNLELTLNQFRSCDVAALASPCLRSLTLKDVAVCDLHLLFCPDRYVCTIAQQEMLRVAWCPPSSSCSIIPQAP